MGLILLVSVMESTASVDVAVIFGFDNAVNVV